ncbi:nucleotide sugar dehydrogenase [Reinekea sp. G2M2-21]|uniref:nucleotide sugar dehydrogenase n=1 Tax=Reinekea sp. G2M2-21 TaxID=2788942 RepID=UPI0018AAA12F|nr:nucleotide sugar dehydrogenase [Reinekea sp. G2M2-21]
MSRKISVIGLGYVGLPVAVSFGKRHKVIGFDISNARVDALKSGVDSTLEVEASELAEADILFTSTPGDLVEADFHIVAVPTPIDGSKVPDLSPLLGASKTVGSVLKAGDIVVFESTVYPGATEFDCIPVLEQESSLKAGVDFFVGYSPERINPGDKEHSFENILKVVSGQNENIANIIAETYASVVKAGVYVAESIQVAEASKVIENTQRDLNIALINELAVIFSHMGIDTESVLEAASTKWNFLPFKPGLVGGHCIGVDPYYLTYRAKQFGYYPSVISAGRRVNDNMSAHVTGLLTKEMIKKEINVAKSRVLVLGITFKEDCPDLRNTKVVDVVNHLKELNIAVDVYDPWVSPHDVEEELRIGALQSLKGQEGMYDAVLIAVRHKQFLEMSSSKIKTLLKPISVLMDLKSVLPKNEVNVIRL